MLSKSRFVFAANPLRSKPRRLRTLIAFASLSIVLTAAPSGAENSDTDSGTVDPVPVQGQPASGVVDVHTFSTTVGNANGTYTAEISGGPVNQMGASGKWRPIDNGFDVTSNGAVAGSSEWGGTVAAVPTDASERGVQVVSPAGAIELQMDGLDGAPEIEGSRAVYSDVENADRVRYVSTYGGLKEDIILESAPSSPVAYEYELDLRGDLRPILRDEGSIDIVDSTGERFAEIPEGIMFDSTDGRAESSYVKYTLRPSGEGWALTVTPDYSWLSDPSRVYPVTVDPSITTAPSSDCFIGTENRDGAHCGDTTPYIRAGKNTEVRRGLVSFDLGPIPGDAVIESASVQLYLDATQNPTWPSADYALYNAAHKWNKATWNTSDREGTWNGAYDSTAAYGQRGFTGAASGYKSFDGLAPLIQAWLSGDIRPNGLLLKQVSENAINELSFYSSAPTTPSGKLPKLVVTYSVPAPSNTQQCSQVVNGDTYQEPSIDGLSQEQAIAAIELEQDTCFVYGSAETCLTDPTKYVSAGCPAESPDTFDQSLGDGSDDEPTDPVYAKTCTDCSAQGGAAIWGGAINGSSLGVPTSGSWWAGASVFGASVYGVGKEKVTDWEIADAKAAAREKKIPVPDSSKTNDNIYRVYTAYSKKDKDHGYFNTWKYGITMQDNNNRLNTAIRHCKNYFERDCAGRYIRQEVVGRYRARLIEMMYIYRYTLKYGHFPKGNPVGM